MDHDPRKIQLTENLRRRISELAQQRGQSWLDFLEGLLDSAQLPKVRKPEMQKGNPGALRDFLEAIDSLPSSASDDGLSASEDHDKIIYDS